MDKSCANHPESMALATCKACDKSVCLMCVVDEKEGTFCSSECHSAHVNGQEVPKFVGAAAESSGAGQRKIDSIFDDDSAPAAPSEELNTPPSDDPMPIVAEGTKWRPIGAQCDAHSDTPAVANCDRCGKPVCALCLLEASQGTFCSSECMSAATSQPEPAAAPQETRARRAAPVSATAERAALQGKPVFKFKAPPKTNPAGMIVAVAVALVCVCIGGYYAWNAFSPPPAPDPIPTPDVVVNPDTTKPVVVTPDTTKPVVIKPDTTKPDTTKPVVVKPDTTKPVVVAGNTQPYIRPKPLPKPVVTLTRVINPWSEHEPGVWYRLRTVRGGQVSYTDIGLKEKGKDFTVLATQTCAGGVPSAISTAKTTPPTMYLRGEESFAFEGQNFLCEIRSTGTDEAAPKTWALLSGKYAGAVFKSVSPEGTMTAKRVWDHTLRVKNRALDCLVIEHQVQNRTVKSWYCGSVPLGLVQQERDGESIALIDLGSDWAKRPAFPK